MVKLLFFPSRDMGNTHAMARYRFHTIPWPMYSRYVAHEMVKVRVFPSRDKSNTHAMELTRFNPSRDLIFPIFQRTGWKF